MYKLMNTAGLIISGFSTLYCIPLGFYGIYLGLTDLGFICLILGLLNIFVFMFQLNLRKRL